MICFFAAISPRWFERIFVFLFFLSKFVLESWEMGARAIMPSDRRDAPPTYRCIDRTIPHRCSSETTQKREWNIRKIKRGEEKQNKTKQFFTYPYPSSCPLPFTGRFYFFFYFLFFFVSRSLWNRPMNACLNFK